MIVKIGNKSFEVSKEELEGNPEEITLEFDGTLRTQEEEATFIENHKKVARTEGAEKAIRTKADELGLEIDGSKRNIDDVFKAYERKILADAKIEPAEQLKKIKSTLEEKETALQNALTKIDEKNNEFSTFKRGMKLDKFLDGVIPDKTLLPREDMKLILKTKLNFDFDENDNILPIGSDGNVLKDPTTANPKNPKDVVDLFFKENQNYLKPVDGGAGGSDSSRKGSKKTLDEFIEEQRAKDINPNSQEFNANLQEQVKQGLVEV
jgi:hypothetical protein